MKEPIVNFEAEKAVIGSCMIDNDVIDRVMFLDESDFYSAAHREMFKAIKKCHTNGEFLDMITMDQYVDSGIVEYGYIADVSGSTPNADNVVAYADRVKEMSCKRQLLDCLNQAIEDTYNKQYQSSDVIAKASQFMDRAITLKEGQFLQTTEEMITESLDEMDKSNEGVRVGIKSGIEEIDERLGFKAMAFGEITALGAQSKNGKTLTANTIVARAEYEPDEVCHIFSIEMPAVGMFNGIVSAMTGVPSDFYVQQRFYQQAFPGKYDNMMNRWGAAATELRDSGRVTIDGNKEVDMDYIVSNIRKQHSIERLRGKKLKLVVIDHAHQMDYPGQASTTEKMGEAFRKLKAVAADLDLAVLVLVQLNEIHKDKEPSSYHILDTSRIRHNIQAFIGTKIFRENGETFFGIYGDSNCVRYANMHTKFQPAYMQLIGGVLRSLPDNKKNWVPTKDEN